MKNIFFYLAALATACVAQELGHVENFEVTDFGNGFITVSWDLVEGSSEYPLHKYSLVIDSDLTSEFRCTDSSCTRTISDLESCVEHTFELTPIFYTPDGNDTNGDVATTSGYTEDDLPGSVSSIVVTADTDEATTLAWSEPSVNAKCVDYYNVCFRLEGESANLCVQSNTTQVTVAGLSACGKYYVTVTPVTPSNSLGSATEATFETHDGVPGEPQDVVVGLITPETIQLLWNNPAENFLCLEKFLITIGETHTRVLRSSVRSSTGYDNEFTFTPLVPCTDYTIDVCSANAAEETSAKVVRYASTEETEPQPPTSVTVTPNGPDSIEVNWGENENDRCAGSFQICWNDGIHPIEQCENVTDNGNNNLIITDLLPCTNYDVIVSVVSPNGTFTSNSTTNSSSTGDVRPGPVVDLKFKSVETNQLTITYLPPETDPQCVKEVITRVIDNDQRLRWQKAVKAAYEETLTGLAACTDYTVQVSTVSPSGKESPVEEISTKTLEDLPSAPQELGANDISTTSITLQWFQPADSPRCVTDYVLTWSDSVSNDSVTIDASTFKVEYTVDDLSACTTYDFSLISESLEGDSDEATLTETTAC